MEKILILRTVSVNGELLYTDEKYEVDVQLALDLVHRNRAVFVDKDHISEAEDGVFEEQSEEAEKPKKRGRPRKIPET